MRAWLLGALLSMVAFASGCTKSDYQPERLAGFLPADAPATAVGESLDVHVYALDASGGPLASYDYQLLEASCDLPGCTAVVDRSANDVRVRSDTAGLAHVSVPVKADPSGTFTFTMEFRVATRILISRAMDDSPAGSAFAMVPGDVQSWYVVPGDDAGPLAVSLAAIAGPTFRDPYGQPPCHAARTIDSYRRVGLPVLECTFGSPTPTAIDFTVSYQALVRKETVRVIPLASVRSASLLLCHTTSHREGTPWNSGPVTDRIPIEEPSPPCEAETAVHYLPPDSACTGGLAGTLVPRLVLDDGTVALGGAKYLSFAGTDPNSPYDDRVQRGVFGGAPESGTIVGRFGDALLTVPYASDAPCPP